MLYDLYAPLFENGCMFAYTHWIIYIACIIFLIREYNPGKDNPMCYAIAIVGTIPVIGTGIDVLVIIGGVALSTIPAKKKIKITDTIIVYYNHSIYYTVYYFDQDLYLRSCKNVDKEEFEEVKSEYLYITEGF